MATITVTTQQNTVSANDLLIVTLTPSETITGLEYIEVRLSGDMGALDNAYRRLTSGSGNSYWFYVAIPSQLGSNGGSFRIQIYHRALSPYLDSDLDVTVRWDSAGRISIIDTADIVYPELDITLDLDYVAIGDRLTATFRFSEVGTQTITGFIAADVSVTEGITKGALVKVSNTEYTMEITAPSSGNGQGVISVAEDSVFPSNTEASAIFLYIDTINAEIGLSAASIENGGTIIAQFDFDYDVPNFSESVVTVGVGAVKGTATALGEENRSWAVPVRVPDTGQGELEISLEEDAIGFQQARVAAQVQHAPTIALAIGNFSDVQEAVIFHDFNLEINITGNDITSVDVEGLLRPFYHYWDRTRGKLYIRGRPKAFYEDLAFKIRVRDMSNAEVEASGVINVVDIAPVIVPPANPLRVVMGAFNSFNIEVQNNPSEVFVEGSWLNLDHAAAQNAIRVFGDVPARGTTAVSTIFGVNQGNLTMWATNKGGSSLRVNVPWEIGSPVAPVFDSSFSGFFPNALLAEFVVEVDTPYTLRLIDYVSGSPTPKLEVSRGQFTAGLELNAELGIVTGTPTATGNTLVLLVAGNSEGRVNVPFRLRVLAANSVPVPDYIGPDSISDVNIFADDNLATTGNRRSVRLESWFNIGSYNGIAVSAQDWELVGTGGLTDLYDRQFRHNNQDRTSPALYFIKGIIAQLKSRDSIRNYKGQSYNVQIKLSNYRGSAITPNFTLNII